MLSVSLAQKYMWSSVPRISAYVGASTLSTGVAVAASLLCSNEMHQFAHKRSYGELF